MTNTLSKKHIGYVLGAILALSIGSIMFMGLSSAGATSTSGSLSADELFGGGSGGDSAFQGATGLGDANLVDTIAAIIRVALGFLGVIAVVIILLGGFKWMTAAGAEDKVKSAKQLIFSGITGMVIILSAYAIASFVIDSIVTATS
ncbi:MAG: hypothetical protein HQ488_01155 [Parcubacteria group bacterium]|nr:hypothetical protein [Parcubacteria group bacterium]